MYDTCSELRDLIGPIVTARSCVTGQGRRVVALLADDFPNLVTASVGGRWRRAQTLAFGIGIVCERLFSDVSLVYRSNAPE